MPNHTYRSIDFGVDFSDGSDWTVVCDGNNWYTQHAVTTFPEPVLKLGESLSFPYDDELSYLVEDSYVIQHGQPKGKYRYPVKLVRNKDIYKKNDEYFIANNNSIEIANLNRLPNSLEDLELLLSYED